MRTCDIEQPAKMCTRSKNEIADYGVGGHYQHNLHQHIHNTAGDSNGVKQQDFVIFKSTLYLHFGPGERGKR